MPSASIVLISGPLVDIAYQLLHRAKYGIECITSFFISGWASPLSWGLHATEFIVHFPSTLDKFSEKVNISIFCNLPPYTFIEPPAKQVSFCHQ